MTRDARATPTPSGLSHLHVHHQRHPVQLVTWELRAEANGCRVTVTHSGWTAEHKAPEKVAAGWTELFGLLETELETRDIPVKTKLMYVMYSFFTFMMPKSTTTEYVDRQGW